MLSDAAMVQVVAQVPIQARDGGSRPTSPLLFSDFFEPRDLYVRPIDAKSARLLCLKHHYLGTYPGGSLLNLGIFANHALVGVAVFSVGPYNVHRFFTDAARGQVITLARFWLDDRCGRNSESRILGVICRLLRRWQNTAKAIVAYSDPAAGHDGGIYRAAGFSYLGVSQATSMYRLPNGKVIHSRSLGHSFGTRSVAYFKSRGIDVKVVQQEAKHTYVVCLDRSWNLRLRTAVLPYVNRS